MIRYRAASSIRNPRHVSACIMAIAITAITHQAPADLIISVTDEKGQPVQSTIFLINSENKEERYKNTDELGICTYSGQCDPQMRFRAKALSETYYYTTKDCPSESNIDLELILKPLLQVAFNLKMNATYLESVGKFGDAALCYNEFYARVIPYDDASANEAREKSLALFGNVLGVQNAIERNRITNRFHATIEFVHAIVIAQQEKGLQETGKLDYPTLKAFSENDIGIYIVALRAPSSHVPHINRE